MRIAALVLAISAFAGVRATPVQADANSACAIPTLLEPTDSQVIVHENRFLLTKISSNDCDSVAVKITNLDTNEVTSREFNRQGYNPVYYTVSDFRPPIGKYVISIKAVDSTGNRPSSSPTPDRRFKYVPRQCTLPSFTPDLAGRVIRQDPAGFSIDVTSTDCGVLQLEIGPEATWPGGREVYFGRVGYDGGTVTLTNRASPLLPYGTYLATLQTGDTDPNQNQTTSPVVGPVRFTIAPPRCPDPTIVTPTPNQRFLIPAGQTTTDVSYEVRSSVDRCRRITYSIVAPGVRTISGTTTDRPYTGTIPSSVGSYTLTVSADDPDDPGSASNQVTRQYVVDAVCPAPSIDRPTVDEHFQLEAGQTKYNVPFSGSTIPRCSRVYYTIVGPTSISGNVNGGPYSGEVPSLAGSYTLKLVAEDPNVPGSASAEATRSYTVDAACPDPFITAPDNGQRYQIPAGASEVTTTLSGTTTTQCNRIDYTITGPPNYTPVVASVDSPPYSGPFTFPAGTFVLTIVASNPNRPGSKSRSVSATFYVDPPAPEATHKMRRRKLQCKMDQTVCPQTDIRGKTFMTCVSDLDINLERCGSCDGPDCTSLPNVNQVQCVAGSCQISSCLKGYYLFNNACLTRKERVFQIQAQKRKRS